MIPHGRKICADFLRAHDAVAAITGRVVTRTPDETDEPWVRVTRLDAANEVGSRPEHLIDFMIQLDCYAGGEHGTDGGLPEAELLARTVRAALFDDLPGNAGVTAVRIVGDTQLPDTAFEPARDRIALTALVWMHS